MNTLAEKGIFFIPAGSEFGLANNKAVYIVYAPLSGRSFLITGSEKGNIEQKLLSLSDSADTDNDPLRAMFAEEQRRQWLQFRIAPEDCLNLTILPNHRCNFRCTYCYSAGGRSNAELNSTQITALATWALQHCAKKNKPCRILFLGGGEPLLSWETMRESILQIEERSKELGATLDFSVSTNGSLLTAEKIDFLRNHKVRVQVSFEVLEDVQNEQRGHYDLVHNNICIALAEGLNPGIHSVITETNIDRMEEVVHTAHKQYPNLKKLGLEPVVDAELLNTPAKAADFYQRFYDGYIKAEKLCQEYGIELLTACSKALETVRTHYCAGQITLTPLGTFSSCEAISNPKENGYQEAIFGKLNEEGQPEFDLQSFRRYHPAEPGFMRDKCSTCWARWNCGGGCNYKRNTLSEDVFDEYCKLNCKLMEHFLANKLRREFSLATPGADLDAVVANTLSQNQ
ncbi:MAG: radical SAM protein [Akkermansiaceae bacterium]|nr:radical SAM protein [Akkermansiaceae bacterium]